MDNNCTDETKEFVQGFIANSSLTVRYVVERQGGLSYARNTGIKHAKGEIIVFTDDDVTVDTHWIERLHSAFQQFGCSAVGGKIIPVWPGPKPPWFEDQGPFATPKAITAFDLGQEVCPASVAPYGANMAFRRRIFEEHGMFRTDLGRTKDVLMGGEDIELFQRLASVGEKVLYIPTAIVFHPVAPERTQRSYFERWCFNAARSQVRMVGFPLHVARCFGLPRYLFRSLTTALLRWIVSIDSKRRFYYKLQVLSIIGTLAEARRLRA